MRETHTSICRFCHASCPILVDVEEGRAVRVLGDKRNPIYHGYTCPKGRALPEQHAHPERLLHSMKRNPSGGFAPIDSTQAMDEVAARLSEIIERYGPRSIAYYTGTFSFPCPAATPVLNALFDSIGSPMRFTSATIDQPGKLIAPALHGIWGGGAQPFTDADTWMLVGANPTVSKSVGVPSYNPAWYIDDAVKRGMKLVVIDPRRSEAAKKAEVHLQAKPGEDPTILAGIIRVVLHEGLYDEAFVAENARGLEDLRARVEPFTPEYVEQRADVPASELIRAARVFAGGRRGMAQAGTGPNMSLRGNLTEYLLLCLSTLCGRWLREGETIPNPGVLLPEVKGKAQPMPPGPGWGFGEKIRVRNLASSMAGLPTAALADEILLEGDGQVRALFCLGGNPLAAWPDQEKTYAAMQKLDLLLTFDIKMSATAKVADYVIAPKLSLEQPGMSLSSESLTPYCMGYSVPYGQYTPQIVDPPAGSDVIEEWEFLYGLAQRMELPLTIKAAYSWGPDMAAPAETALDMQNRPTTDELFEMLTRDANVPLEEVKKYPHGHIFEEVATKVAARDPDCTARLELANETMLAELADVAEEDFGTDSEFPFLLTCRRLLDVHNSAGRDIEKLVRKFRYNPAFMNPDDLKDLDIAPGDVVEVRSDHSTILGVAEAEANLRRGIVSMPHAFGDAPTPENDARVREIGSNTGRLTPVDRAYDPYSGIPRMSSIPVHVRRHRKGAFATGA
jgi:anaerobic selenocysteine-containing dehydrogenase